MNGLLEHAEITEPQVLCAPICCPRCGRSADRPAFVLNGDDRVLCSDPFHQTVANEDQR